MKQKPAKEQRVQISPANFANRRRGRSAQRVQDTEDEESCPIAKSAG